MSSTSRSPDGQVPPVEESGSRPAETGEIPTPAPGAPEKRRASPGRYSLSDDDDATVANRIDSTMQMPAVRPPETPTPRSSRTNLAAVSPPPTPQPSPKPPLPAGAVSGTLPKKPDVPRPTLTSPNPPMRSTGVTSPSLPSRTAVTGPSLPSRAQIGPPPPSTRERVTSADAGQVSSDSASTVRDLPPRSSVTGANLPKPPVFQRFQTQRAMVAPPSPGAAPIEDQRVSIPPPSMSPKFDPLPHPSLPKPSRASADLAAIALERHSTAPPSPRPPPPSGGLGVLDLFDDGSIASAFDALVSEETISQAGTLELDLGPVRELFAELAANHMRHVRDFMIDVKWGEVTRDWIEICAPPVRTLRRAAERLELKELATALDKLAAELERLGAAGGSMLDRAEKQRLLEAYNALVEILPQAFALDGDKTQREAVIVQALLLQVPDVRKVTIDKLHAAGLTSLTVLFEAKATDLERVAHIPLEVATRIIARVDAYRNELKSSSPSDARAAERERLAQLAKDLKQHHEEYEKASNGWGEGAKKLKREHFLGREEAWLEISVLLARFGEVNRLQGIEKVPFAQRITQLNDYLEDAADKYRVVEGG